MDLITIQAANVQIVLTTIKTERIRRSGLCIYINNDVEFREHVYILMKSCI